MDKLKFLFQFLILVVLRGRYAKLRWDHRPGNHAFEGIVMQEYSPEEKRLIGKPMNIYKGSGFGATEAYFDIGHEGHTGTFIGMACQDLSGRNLHADFESFTYRRLEQTPLHGCTHP